MADVVVGVVAGAAVVADDVRTTTVPCMLGWTVQWYGNVPTVVNLWDPVLEERLRRGGFIVDRVRRPFHGKPRAEHSH